MEGLGGGLVLAGKGRCHQPACHPSEPGAGEARGRVEANNCKEVMPMTALSKSDCFAGPEHSACVKLHAL